MGYKRVIHACALVRKIFIIGTLFGYLLTGSITNGIEFVLNPRDLSGDQGIRKTLLYLTPPDANPRQLRKRVDLGKVFLHFAQIRKISENSTR